MAHRNASPGRPFRPLPLRLPRPLLSLYPLAPPDNDYEISRIVIIIIIVIRILLLHKSQYIYT